MPRIIPRAEWGFDGWLGGSPPSSVALSQRTEFFVHYDGEVSVGDRTGVEIPRSTHRYHRDVRGWAGIGYNFIIDNVTGDIYEGRGWDYQGAHCTGHNISGIGAQLHIGGDDEPSNAGLASLRWLYDEQARLTGRTPAMKGHRDGTPSTCPGENLYAWVLAGMPSPAAAQPQPEPVPDAIGPALAALSEQVAALAAQVALLGTEQKAEIARVLEALGKSTTSEARLVELVREALTGARVTYVQEGALSWPSP